jgi:hypothetical protein
VLENDRSRWGLRVERSSLIYLRISHSSPCTAPTISWHFATGRVTVASVVGSGRDSAGAIRFEALGAKDEGIKDDGMVRRWGDAWSNTESF